MAAGPQLRAYGANLDQTGRNVHEVRGVVQSVRQQIDNIEMVIDAIDVIEQRADEFGDTVAKLKLALKLMDKTGPLKLVAKAGMAVLDGVQRVAQAIEAKADQLARKIDDSRLEQKLADAGERLDTTDLALATVENALLFDAAVIGGLVRTLDTIDALDPTGDPGRQVADAADALVMPPNAALAALNDGFADVRSLVLSLQAAVPDARFLPALGVRVAFDKIDASLDFLRGPLDVVARVLKPIEGILDAVGFIFNLVVGPVIDFVMNTLGIDRLMASVSARINGLLPDAGVLDPLLADIDTAFEKLDPLGSLDDYLGVTAWLDDIVEDMLDPVGSLQSGPIGIGTAQSDRLQGTSAAEVLDAGAGDDALSGGAGDDLLLAGPGNDLLDGETGHDTAVFRGSFFEYSYSQAVQGDSITFQHLRPALPGARDGIDETRNIETFTFADLSLTRQQLLESVIVAGAGQTRLEGSEQTDLLLAGSSAITIDARGGNDVLVGSPANDTLLGGGGDDTVLRSGGNDTIDGGAGSDTWRFALDNSSGNPPIDVDLASGIVRVSTTTSMLASIENVVIEDSRTAYLFGSALADRLIASASRDLLDGRGGDDLLDGGAGDDILIGGPGADSLYGGEGTDTLIAADIAASGVSNHYDGGAGDADTLVYAGNIRDFITREYIDTQFRNKALAQQASGPLRIHAGTGVIERLADDGATVVASDLAIGIERFVGSDADDLLYGAPGESGGIDGGPGNDTLEAGPSNGSVAGGAGDDLLIAGTGGASYDGGTGFDVLDLSRIDGVRWLVRLSGATGSALRAYNAVAGGELAVPGASLQNESGPSLLGSGTVGGIERYIGGADDDYFEFRSLGLITVEAGDGDDFLLGDTGGSNNPSFVLNGEGGNDHLILAETGRADGGAGDDLIVIRAANSDKAQAFGGTGDDLLELQSGTVDIDGGEDLDVLRAGSVNARAGFVLDLAAGTVASNSATPHFTGTVRGIESVVGADAFADILRGSDAGESFAGAGGNDLIEARGGHDSLSGGPGIDTLRGGDGDDWLHGGAGNDTLDGGPGIDTASWAFAAPGSSQGTLAFSAFGHVDADLTARAARLTLLQGGTETDSLPGIENLVGGAGNDTLRGDGGPNLLVGGEGADLLEGRDGNDVLVLDGPDTAIGGEGDDRFVIGLGDVSIDAGPGLDVLDFGSLTGTLRIDPAGGTYQGEFDVEHPVWRVGAGTEPRRVGTVTFTPQSVLETDPVHANSLDDFARIVPADPSLEIDFVTVRASASGRFVGIEQFVGGPALETAAFDGARADFAVARDGTHWRVSPRDDGSSPVPFSDIESLSFADMTLPLIGSVRPATVGPGLDPNFLFDPVFYLLANSAVVPDKSSAGALAHWTAQGTAQGRAPTSWFDADWYQQHWPDLTSLGLDDQTLFAHFNLYGVWEGRAPGPRFDGFDGPRYLQDNPDVAAYVDAYLPDFLGSRTNGGIAHFPLYGADEQRTAFGQDGQPVGTDYIV